MWFCTKILQHFITNDNDCDKATEAVNLNPELDDNPDSETEINIKY